MKNGAKGIKTQVSGRLGGLTSLVLNNTQKELFHFIHYVLTLIMHAEADTTYGKLGVKVWIYRGEVLPTKNTSEGGK